MLRYLPRWTLKSANRKELICAGAFPAKFTHFSTAGRSQLTGLCQLKARKRESPKTANDGDPMKRPMKTPALGPLDTAIGGSEAAVLEIVTFKLASGANRAAFLRSARNIDDWLRARGSVRQRLLTESEDGTWSDTVEWSSMDAARSAAAEFPQVPEFATIMQAIDKASVALRHETIRWRLT